MIQHLRLNKRSCFYINLDPAAEDFSYEPDLDIKDLISVEDVMEEMDLGPNGGLIYCFEYGMIDAATSYADEMSLSDSFLRTSISSQRLLIL